MSYLIQFLRALFFSAIGFNALANDTVPVSGQRGETQSSTPASSSRKGVNFQIENIDYNFKLLLVGGSSKGGTGWIVSEAICNAVNKKTRDTKLRCGLMETAGSEFNMMAVTNGVVQVALVQGDIYEDMILKYEEAADEVRVITQVARVPMSVFVRQGVDSVDALKGKTFNVGVPGSGSYVAALNFLNASGLEQTDFGKVEYIPVSEVAAAFCENRVDAGVFFALHPTSAYTRIMKCGGTLFSLPSDTRDVLLQKVKRTKAVTIAKDTYPNLSADVSTVGVPLYLITSAEVDSEAIYRLTQMFLANYPAILKRAPFLYPEPFTLAELKVRNTPDLHPGALRALSEPAAALARQSSRASQGTRQP